MVKKYSTLKNSEPIPLEKLKDFIGQTIYYEYGDEIKERGSFRLKEITGTTICGFAKDRNSLVEFFNSQSVKFYIKDE